LTNACGFTLDSSVLQHEPPASTSTSNYHSTHQSRPSDWKLWDHVLSIWFDDDANACRPLDKWLYTGDKLCRTWKSYYDSHDQQLYHQTVDSVSTVVGTSTGFQLLSLTSWLPSSSSYPVHLRTYDNSANFYLTPLDQPLPIPATVVTLVTFEQYVATLPTWEQHLFASIELLVPPFHLHALINSTLSKSDKPLQIQLCRIAPKSPRQCPSVGALLSLMALALLIVLARALAPGLHTMLKVMAFSLPYDFSTAFNPSFLLLILGQPASRLTIWASSPA
jgi:hypothetical protein